MSLFENVKLSDVKKDYRKFKNELSKRISKDLSEELCLEKILQMTLGSGKEVKVNQMTFNLKNAKGDEKLVNLTGVVLGKVSSLDRANKGIKLMTSAPFEVRQGYKLTTPVLTKKTDEYKAREVNLGENKLIVKEKSFEKAREILNDFLDLFKQKLNEATNLYKQGIKDYTKPVIELFRDYTIFKGTVFGKQGVGFEYAKNYFKKFVKEIPTDIRLNELVDFEFTEDGLVVKGGYTFFTENKGKINGTFLMIIGEDNKGKHFKVFHSSLRDLVIS